MRNNLEDQELVETIIEDFFHMVRTEYARLSSTHTEWCVTQLLQTYTGLFMQSSPFEKGIK